MYKDFFIRVSTLCHELIGDGLQQLRLVVLGADKVSITRRSGLQRREGGPLDGQTNETKMLITKMFKEN